MVVINEIGSNNSIVLGIDIGTTNIRCYAYDNLANVIGKAEDKVQLTYGNAGIIEIEPDKLWEAFKKVVKNCLKYSHLTIQDIKCMGISTQRGTFITWNKITGKEYHNFITWKDTRAEKISNEWNSAISIRLIRLGAQILYLFSRQKRFQVFSAVKWTSSMVIMKLIWVLDHFPQIRLDSLQNEALFGTIDTWLVWKLTNGTVHATEGSNACVTGFFDPFKMEWPEWILKMLNIPLNMLPMLYNTSDSFGEIVPEIFGASVPINALVGDQQASLFGACCLENGDMNCTLGTGSFLNINTGTFPSAAINGGYPLVGWTINSQTTYITEFRVDDAGTIIDWAQKIGLFQQPSESNNMARSIEDTGGVYFLPGLNMQKVSTNENYISYAFVGLNIQTSKEHMVRSILETLAFQICMLYEYLVQAYTSPSKINVFSICGGISKNDFIVQLIADVTSQRIYRLKHCETSSLGAAFLAGLYSGVWKNQHEISTLQRETDIFFPNHAAYKKCHQVLKAWKRELSHSKRLQKT